LLDSRWLRVFPRAARVVLHGLAGRLVAREVGLVRAADHQRKGFEMGALRSVAGIVLFAGSAAVVFGAFGCAPPALQERRASVRSKYLAPTPVLTAKASKAARTSYGIDEWRIYRGKGGVYVTGFNAKGKAIRGLSTEFARTQGGAITDLRTRVNDGNEFLARHVVKANLSVVSRSMPVESQEFVRRAVLDLARLRTAIVERQSTSSNPSALLCGQTLIDAVTTPVLELGALDAKTLAALGLLGSMNGSGALCEKGASNVGFVTIGKSPVDQFDASMCTGSFCANQMKGLDFQELGGAGTWRPDILMAEDGRLATGPGMLQSGAPVGRPGLDLPASGVGARPIDNGDGVLRDPGTGEPLSLGTLGKGAPPVDNGDGILRDPGTGERLDQGSGVGAPPVDNGDGILRDPGTGERLDGFVPGADSKSLGAPPVDNGDGILRDPGTGERLDQGSGVGAPPVDNGDGILRDPGTGERLDQGSGVGAPPVDNGDGILRDPGTGERLDQGGGGEGGGGTPTGETLIADSGSGEVGFA
jgi:hypothetical protein